MAYSQEYKDRITQKEDMLFDKSSSRYADMTILDEIFDILDEPDFAQNFPKQHFREVARIRDLKNSIDTAYKKGLESGKRKAKIETAKLMLKDSCEVALISEITGLTAEEIENLK
ncbi:MAG: hypothetical protein KGV44_13895 [Flavobacteriaceae bacterium]|nr:hypothetical protein [Flavobacteriaceae bacterium]